MGVFLHLPSFSLVKQPRLGLGKTILPQIDGSPPFASQKPKYLITISSVTPDGSRRGGTQRRISPQKRPTGETKKLSNDKLSKNPTESNQEEIISLFKRIQSSISKEKSESTGVKKKFESSEDEPMAETLLDIIRQSRKKLEGGGARKWQQSNFKQVDVDFKLTRPPSNFIKRSPIPSHSVPRVKLLELKREERLTAKTGESEGDHDVKKMKLSELKEVAKARGIKGYSRLKKSELVEMLKSS